jgi:hypothetical protein
MREERIKTLKNIEEIINRWKISKFDEESALSDIYDEIEKINELEEMDMRRRMREEMDKNSITIQAKVRFMGKLEPGKLFNDEEE